MDSDCEKMKRMKSSWHNVVVLVGFLRALNLAAFFAELSQGILQFHVTLWVSKVIRICK